ncbi:CPBP family intramembrane glutamic endopeptidase [Thermoanaerobacterium sp. RBIITD]|uniref:CPBP family intramembrane glutamic endopeptidase n=1 Tax=Thermoanaerobacterium sp. RBIITD TaxID=1550240 RepID=UPI000BB87050|nr:CPBP family intramembrane glutamic endopeptidase [Thermoanaerobacterium sp. RBIITD]SNX55316.1 hypothetical protein SAMN05660242_3138 [Thermoanaerobacterium sp. RBIITD]
MFKKLNILIFLYFIFEMALYFSKFIMTYLFEGIYHFFNLKDNDPFLRISSNLIYNYTIQILMLFLALYLLKRFKYTKYIKISVKAIIKLIAFTILLFICTKYALSMFSNNFLWTELKYAIKEWSKLDYIVAILQVALFMLVALAEEYLFRIILYLKILEISNFKNNTLKTIFSIILTNILFSIGHLSMQNYDFYMLLQVFISGIYFSYLFLRTNNIYLACIMHFNYDFPIMAIVDKKYYFQIASLIISVVLIEGYFIIKYYYLKLFNKCEQS